MLVALNGPRADPWCRCSLLYRVGRSGGGGGADEVEGKGYVLGSTSGTVFVLLGFGVGRGRLGWLLHTGPTDGVFVAFCVRACVPPPLAPVYNLFAYLRFGFSPRVANALRAVVVVVFQISADERFFLRPKERKKISLFPPYFPGWRDIFRPPPPR